MRISCAICKKRLTSANLGLDLAALHTRARTRERSVATIRASFHRLFLTQTESAHYRYPQNGTSRVLTEAQPTLLTQTF